MRPRWPGVALLVLGLGLAANSVLGPLVLGVIDYRFSHALLAQGWGLDLVSLAVAAPLAVGAGAATLRGRTIGPALALGLGAYAAYMAVQYVVGPEYLSLAGDNERFFLLHLGLFVTGLATVVGAWRTVDAGSLPPGTGKGARGWSVVLALLGLFLLLRYLPLLVRLTAGDPPGAEFRENPTSFLLIAFLDLGVLLPATVAGAVGLWRERGWARKVLHLVTGWWALVAVAVAAMAVTMWARGDPAGSAGGAAGFTLTAVVLSGLAVRLEGPLLAERGRPVGDDPSRGAGTGGT